MTRPLAHVRENLSAQQRLSQGVTKQWLLLAAILTTACCDRQLFAQGNQTADAGMCSELRLSKPILISDQNRKQNGTVFGGWGPHLRSVLRINDDSLWYVMDHSKGDISNNDQLFYFQQKAATWKRVAQQDLIPGANQGYAHITNGEEIFSYGANSRLSQLHECRLNAKSLIRHDCAAVRNRSGQVIDLGGGANYVGAAISPSGTRLVWWVVVARDGAGYQWRYVYNRGNGWHGPVVTTLGKDHGALSYVYARFVSETQVALSGQVWVGQFPEGTPRAILTHFRLGTPILGFHTLKSPDEKGFPKSGSDLWVNPKTGTIHAIVEGFGNEIHYYNCNVNDPWREYQPVQSLRGYFRARFTETQRGDLYLVLGGTTGSSKIDVLHVRKERINDPIDWNKATRISATMPATEQFAPAAIWIENRAYQTTPVRSLNFAFTGEYPHKDDEIWFCSGTLRRGSDKQRDKDLPEYRIETIAGNGKPGDTPAKGGPARDVPVDYPFGVEYGPDGALYITTAASHRVLRFDGATGQITTVAGNGRQGYSGDGGPATGAMLNEPHEVRFDSHGNMLILEMRNHLIRRVDARTGLISTLAGDGVPGDRGDGGPAGQARFRAPHNFALDKHDNIYISDILNHRVRRIDAKSRRIETVVGNGKQEFPQDGGLAKKQPLLTPGGIVIHGDDLWITSYKGHMVWRLDFKTGLIHRVAGTGRQGYTGDGGNPLDATFDGPRGITMSPAGVLYVVEGENNIIRAIDTVRGSIRTIAGTGPKRHVYAGDGLSALGSPLWQPHGICVGRHGSLVLSDTKNHRVRRLLPVRQIP